MPSLNPYQVLGLSPGASDEQIRHAYRQLARQYHPDVNESPGAEDFFKELAQAFSVLTDPRRRAMYDEFGEASLRLGFDPERARRRRARQASWSAAPDPEPPEDDSWRGPGDLVQELALDLGFSLSGGEAHVPSPTGRSSISVQVPAGVLDGARLRIPGRGEVGRGGARPGDLVVVVRVKPNPHYRREGHDLHLELPITVSEAVRGASVEVPAPGGRLRLRIPAGCQGDEELRMRGKGLRHERGGAGDLIVRLSIRLPEKTGPVTRALDQLSSLYRKHVREGLKL